MRQRTKLGLALVVLALVLGSVVAGGVELFRQDAREQAQASVQQSAETVADQTAEEIQNRLRNLYLLGTRRGISRLTDVERNLTGFARHSQFRTAVLVAPNGTIVAVGGPLDAETRSEIVGTNLSGQPYIDRALSRDRGVARVGPVQADPDGGFLLQAAAPVTVGDEVVGAVAGAIPVSRVTGSIRAVGTGEADSRRAVQLSAWNGSAERVIVPPDPVFDDPLSANATVSLPGTSWVVTMYRTQRPLEERLDWLGAIQFGGLVVVFGGILGLGYWEYATNLRQTERLLEGFGELRTGNYDHTVSLSAATEWRRVAEGFNTLAQGLADRERAVREREQQLAVLNRVLRHNLRNDMNVIIGHAELLTRYDDDTQVERAVETIIRTGEELVSHGRKARKLETVMGSDVTLTTVDVSTKVASVVDAHRASNPRATIRTDLAPDATAHALESFQAAVDNLVENAIEHNDSDEPIVDVAVETGEGTVLVRISDDGPGIPAHEREVIQSGAESALEHGSGIGLWLAFWLVDRSGGSLSFAERDRRGSVVTIELEAADPSAAPDRGPPNAIGGRSPLAPAVAEKGETGQADEDDPPDEQR